MVKRDHDKLLSASASDLFEYAPNLRMPSTKRVTDGGGRGAVAEACRRLSARQILQTNRHTCTVNSAKSFVLQPQLACIELSKLYTRIHCIFLITSIV